MGKKYEIMLTVSDPKTYKWMETKARRTFDDETKANAYVEDIKRGGTVGITNCDGKMIDTSNIRRIVIRERWY